MYAYFHGISLVHRIFYLSFALYVIHIPSQTLSENQILRVYYKQLIFIFQIYIFMDTIKKI